MEHEHNQEVEANKKPQRKQHFSGIVFIVLGVMLGIVGIYIELSIHLSNKPIESQKRKYSASTKIVDSKPSCDGGDCGIAYQYIVDGKTYTKRYEDGDVLNSGTVWYDPSNPTDSIVVNMIEESENAYDDMLKSRWSRLGLGLMGLSVVFILPSVLNILTSRRRAKETGASEDAAALDGEQPKTEA